MAMEDSTQEHLENAEHAEHAAHEGNPFLTTVSVTIAVLAVLAATVGSFESLETAEAINDKSEAAYLQNKASDQWAFFEVPGFIGASREALTLDRGGDTPLLRQGIGEPLRGLEVELSRPYFWLEEGVVETSAYRLNDRLAMVHRLSSNLPGGDQHGIALELF